MYRFLIVLVVLAASVAGPVVSLHGQEQMPLPSRVAKALVDSLSHTYYEAKFAFYPAYATSKGVRSYDSTLSTYEPLKVSRFVRSTSRAWRELTSFAEDSLDIQTWVDLKALLSDMSTQMLWLDSLAMWHKSPMLYVDACIDGLYYIAIRDPEFWSDPNFSSRLATVPQVLANAKKNLSDPIRLHCEVAAASARAFLPFLKELRDPAGEAFKHLDPAVVSDAYAACDQFGSFLDSLSASPAVNPVFALGYDNFTKLLYAQHMVDESPEEILAYAEKTLRDSKAALEKMGEPPPPPEVNEEAAAAITKDEILEAYWAETDSAVAFLTRKELVTLPVDAPVEVVESPIFLKVLVPGYAYEPPGPFDEEQVGLLYVPLPETLDAEARTKYQRIFERRGLRGIVAHELYPGHHLQLVEANRNPSFVRKLQSDDFMAEGWALYCEQMMAEAGYTGPSGARGALRGVVFRAARAIVDVKLQLGQFSLQQATDFMVQATAGDRDFLAEEVRRYAVDPAQPMSYLMGRKAILEVRDQFRGILGKEFTLKKFHDTLLSCGTIPPYLLRICATSRAMGRSQ